MNGIRMLNNARQQLSSASDKRVEAMTWGAIFGLATVAVALLFWMGSASRAGEPLGTVSAIGFASVVLAGVAALIAVKFSRRP